MRKKISFANRMMKTIVLITLVLIVSVQQARGSEKPEVSVDVGILNKYVWRGLIITDDPVVQPSFTLSTKGLGLNIWANNDLTDKGASGASEITELDYTLDYSFEVKQWSFDLGAIIYTFPNTGSQGTVELFGSAGYEILLSPSLSIYYDVDEAGGIYGVFSLSYTFPLGELWKRDMSLDLSGSQGYASSGWNEFYYGVNSSSLVDLAFTAEVPVELDESLTIDPFITYSYVVDNELQRAVSNDQAFIYGVNFSFSW